MPTLFDSHDEFNEWFSKGIESQSQQKSAAFDQSLRFDLLLYTLSYLKNKPLYNFVR